MAYSFFIGTEWQLYTGSQAFAAKISAAPEAFGLGPAQAAAYASLNEEFVACYEAALDPQTRTSGRIMAKNDAAARLRKMASDLAKIIKGTLSVTDAQKLELGLNVRKQRSPKPAPGVPNEFRVELLGDGSVRLRWKCSNPPGAGGTMYHIWRRVDATAAFTYFGITGQKKYTDDTLPAGASQVIYRVQAFRSTSAGEAAEFIVHLGSVDRAVATAAVTEDRNARVQIAA